jgi:ElaB/YqjD/DUF883 family membrane-anchored ribosome-binding protein
MPAETADVSGVRHKVDEFVTGIKEKATQMKQKSLEDLWGGARDYVKENPGKTILVSLGVGILIGSILRRR